MPIQLTRAVKTLIITYFVVFLFQQTGDRFFETHLISFLGLVPSAVIHHGMVWQIFSYSFLHSDVMHLFFNALMLAFIGSEIERVWGRARFLRYFFFCATASALFYLCLQWVSAGAAMGMPMVGSSGAIYGLLTAYGLIFGERVLLLMLLFPLKAKHFVLVLAGIELMTTFYSSGGAMASAAHLGGMAAGLLYLWVRTRYVLQKGRTPQKKSSISSKKRKSNHLKLVVNQSANPGSRDRHGGGDGGDDDLSDHKPRTWH